MRDDDIALEIYYDGAWHDLVIDDKVLADQEIVITRGDGAESAAIRPCTITAGLDNATDMFRTSNPESPLYGKAGRNTPVRVSVGGVVRGTAEASSWTCEQSRDFRATPRRGWSRTDLEAGGLLQRVGQWSDTLPSALARTLPTLTGLTGLWLLEDKSEATQLANALSGGQPGTASGDVALGVTDSTPDGAASVVTTNSGAVIAGRFARSTASGWLVSFCVKLETGLAWTASYEEIFRWKDTAGRTWAWETNDTDWAIRVYAADGSTLSYTAQARGFDARTTWSRVHIRVTVSAGTVTYTPVWYYDGATAYLTGGGGTFASTTTGGLDAWTTPATTYGTGASYAAVVGIASGGTDFENNAGALAAFQGHRNERAGSRFLRLLEEAGLGRTLTGTQGSTQLMGPQRPDTLINQLREIRDTDDGLICDDRSQARIRMITRVARYAQTAVTIDVSELVNVPREVVDDLGIYNDVTVAQRDGSEAHLADDTGPLGTQAPPDGAGRYERRIDVNVYDESDLLPLASWWLRRGTVDVPRYAAVTVNLSVLDRSRVTAIEAVDVGGVIEITGFRENPIRLFVLGMVERIPWKRARTITFTCFPDQQFNVGVYDSAGGRRYDLATCTTSGSHGPTATTITLAITADEAWSSTSAYDLFIAGELVGVPVGGMGARTGSAGAYQQVITGAVRSKNGVRKTLPAGSEVHVSTPGRWAR